MLFLQAPPTPPIKVEVRERFEIRNDRDFNSDAEDHRSDLLSRWRIGTTIEIDENVDVQLQYQYAHDLIWTPKINFSTENSDLLLGNIQVTEDSGKWTLGRQKIAYGDQRLIGPLEWSNLSRSFDAIRFEGENWDAWIAMIGVSKPRPQNDRLGGFRYQSPAGESVVILKHDKTAAGDVDHATFSHLWRQSNKNVSLEAEGVLQFGDGGDKRQEAWAIHARATKPLDAKNKAYLEVNAASGGSGKNVNSTFDNLYPTNHNKYGIADLQGWKNMQEIALGVINSPSPQLVIKASYHIFALQNSRDAWYGAGGAPNRYSGGVFVDTTGSSGRDVGQEFDLEASWKLDQSSSLDAGLAFFDPGKFVSEISGQDDVSYWGYVSFQKKW